MKKLGEMTRAVVLAGLALAGTASADVVTDWNQIIGFDGSGPTRADRFP